MKRLYKVIVSRVFTAMSYGLIAPFLIIFFKELGGSFLKAGSVLALSMAVQSLFSPIGGWISDRASRKTVIIVSGFIFSVTHASWILVSSIYHAYILVFLSAIFEGLSFPSYPHFASNITEGRYQATSLAVLRVSRRAFIAIATLAAGYLLSYFGSFSLLFILSAVFQLLGTIMFFFVDADDVSEADLEKPYTPADSEVEEQALTEETVGGGENEAV